MSAPSGDTSDSHDCRLFGFDRDAEDEIDRRLRAAPESALGVRPPPDLDAESSLGPSGLARLRRAESQRWPR